MDEQFGWKLYYACTYGTNAHTDLVACTLMHITIVYVCYDTVHIENIISVGEMGIFFCFFPWKGRRRGLAAP